MEGSANGTEVNDKSGGFVVNEKSGQISPPGSNDMGARNQRNIGMLMDLDLPISVELGRIRMMVKDILELGPGALIELNKFSGEPVDIYVNDKKFAEGEVVVVEQNFGVRITALVGPDERLMNLK
jgi:flagellar motor switch protein FliN